MTVRRASALRMHLRVVHALLLREMATRYGRSAGGYVWAVAEPVGMVAMLALVFSALTRSPPLGHSFIAFFATGYIGFAFYRSTADVAGQALLSNQPLLRFPGVHPWDAVVARLWLQALTNIAVAAIVLAGAFALSGEQVAVDPPYLAACFATATLLGAGIGCCNAVLFVDHPIWQRVHGILTRPLFLISGVFFLPETLPRDVQDALSWNPLLHLISALRRAVYPVYHARNADLLFPATLGCFTLLIGLLLLRARRGRMQSL